ncbi:3-deoxy-7-phosphoheptulonate synthase [Selenomonadales bacterium OttesenSCG-928-I06]|nr:3-deoxy-7-phosphoheptulonate synthase [Selenomonadales bacterium OttesenSCG-928-I06]
MLIIMSKTAKQSQIENIINRIEELGLKVHVSKGDVKTIIGVIGSERIITQIPLEAMHGVEKTISITSNYQLVTRDFKPENTVIDVNGVEIGGLEIAIMAGPCAVESLEQLILSAKLVKEGGAKFLRGGAYKPRTSPYSFQGLEEDGLKMLAKAREETGLKIVTEVIDSESAPIVAEYADVLQIGARNMQNFQLLKAVGKINKPVLLKRGLAATLSELLYAAEYIMNEGNYNVILCERGIRTFEDYTRNTLDLSAVAALKQISHLPVIVDPSHGTGRWKLVAPMAKAALAAGADGLIIEVHPNPEDALSDGAQSLTPENFNNLVKDCVLIAEALGRKITL